MTFLQGRAPRRQRLAAVRIRILHPRGIPHTLHYALPHSIDDDGDDMAARSISLLYAAGNSTGRFLSESFYAFVYALLPSLFVTPWQSRLIPTYTPTHRPPTPTHPMGLPRPSLAPTRVLPVVVLPPTTAAWTSPRPTWHTSRWAPKLAPSPTVWRRGVYSRQRGWCSPLPYPHVAARTGHGAVVSRRRTSEMTLLLALGTTKLARLPLTDTSSRYILRYVIHRLMRVAKYAAIGAAVAFVGTGVLGAVGSGVAWFMAPGIGMGMGVGMVWACVKVRLCCVCACGKT